MNAFWETAKTYLNTAGKMMGLDQEVVQLYKKPMYILEFQIPVRMDDGKMRTFTAYRVRHNDALGPTKDGVRIKPDLTLEEVEALALIMTIKHGIAEIPAGGGKGGIVANPQELSEQEFEQLCRGFIRRLVPKGTWVDVPGADIGTSGQTMAWMLDEYEQIIGYHSPAAINDKPPLMGGSLGGEEATGRGIFYIAHEAARKMNFTAKATQVVIQGFGQVGSNAAHLLYHEGYKIISVSDVYGGIYNPSGLNIPQLIDYVKEKGSVTGFPGTISVDNNELLFLDCDILIPAAVQTVIKEDNADKVKAKLIVEGANGPLTPEADKILTEKGTVIIPDVLANCGGVIVCHFERTQGLTDYFWDIETVRDALRKRIIKVYEETCSLAKEKNITLREAAWIKGFSKVHAAMQLRGRI